jgi:FtsH-binding integral membrane protein
VVLLFVTLTLVAAFALVGLVSRWDPDKWFGEGKPGTLLSVGLLGWAGVASISAGLSLGSGRLRLAWSVFGALLITAAADDMVKIHERLDVWLNGLLGWDPEGPADVLDDLLVLGYAIAGVLVVAVLMRRYALRLPGLMWNLVIAGAVFGVMVVLDVAEGADWLEESGKVVAAAIIVNGVRAARRSPLHARLERAARAPLRRARFGATPRTESSDSSGRRPGRR